MAAMGKSFCRHRVEVFTNYLEFTVTVYTAFVKLFCSLKIPKLLHDDP